MAVVTLGLFSNTIQGIEGAILLALAHGWSSSALFIIVGGIIYERTGTRIIPYIRGLATFMPVSTILFFIFTLCNTGIPLSINFLGEQLSLIGIWNKSPIVAVLGASSIVFSAIYSIWLYNRLSYGTFSPHLKPLKDINRREFILLITLLIPTIVLGIFPNVILDSLHMSVTSLLYNTTTPNTSVNSPLETYDHSSFIISSQILLSNAKTVNKFENSFDNLSNNVDGIKSLAKKKGKEDFLNWLTGFTDGEGTFFIQVRTSGKTDTKVSFGYKISLHIDDVEVLKKIKLELSQLAGKEVGSISISNSIPRASLTFNDFSFLTCFIIPIFNAYPLRTCKYLDFKDWEKAINIKNQATNITSLPYRPQFKLSEDQLNNIINLKMGCVHRTGVELILIPH